MMLHTPHGTHSHIQLLRYSIAMTEMQKTPNMPNFEAFAISISSARTQNICRRTLQILQRPNNIRSRRQRAHSSNRQRHWPAPSPVSQGPRPCRCSAEAESSAALPGRRTAVIIVDHGSRRPESNQQLEEFVQLYRCILHRRRS